MGDLIQIYKIIKGFEVVELMLRKIEGIEGTIHNSQIIR